MLPANDGPSAVALSRTHPGDIHLLLTNSLMPAMPGRRAGRGRSVTERPDIIVIYMSEFAPDAFGAARPPALLQKPFGEVAAARRRAPPPARLSSTPAGWRGRFSRATPVRCAGAASRAQARRQAEASGPRWALAAPSIGAAGLTERRACHQSDCTSRARVATAASTRSENRCAFSPSSGVMGAPNSTAMGERRSRPPWRASEPEPPGGSPASSGFLGRTWRVPCR